MIKMKLWQSEPNTQDEIATMVKGVVHELQQGDTSYSVYVGGNTLVYGSIDPDGNMDVFECEIRRAHTTIEDQAVLTAVPIDKALTN